MNVLCKFIGSVAEIKVDGLPYEHAGQNQHRPCGEEVSARADGRCVRFVVETIETEHVVHHRTMLQISLPCFSRKRLEHVRVGYLLELGVRRIDRNQER